MVANTTFLAKASRFIKIFSWIYLAVIPIFLLALLNIKDPEVLGLMNSTQPGFIPDWIFWGIVVSTQSEKFIGYFLFFQGVSCIIEFLLAFTQKMNIQEEAK